MTGDYNFPKMFPCSRFFVSCPIFKDRNKCKKGAAGQGAQATTSFITLRMKGTTGKQGLDVL